MPTTSQELLVIARLQDKATRPLKELRGEFDHLAKEIQQGEKASASQRRELRQLGSEMKRTQKEARDLAQHVSNVGQKMSQFLSVPIAAGLGYAIKAASDLNEQVSKTGAVFGAAGASVTAFVNDSTRNLLLSKRAAQEAASTIGALLIPMGASQRQAADMSIALTSLAQDLSSFYDADPATALSAINSGLVGEPEPLRRFGVQLSENRVQAWAYSHGIAAANTQLTDLQKTTARYQIILNDTTLAQGDAARTLGSAANEARRMQKEIDDAAAEIGSDLLPLVAKVASGVADMAHGFSEMPDPMQKVVLGLAGVAFFAGPIASLAGKILFVRDAIMAAKAAGGLSWLTAGAAGAATAGVALGVGAGMTINANASSNADMALAALGPVDESNRADLEAHYARVSQMFDEANRQAGSGPLNWVRQANQNLSPFNANTIKDAQVATNRYNTELARLAGLMTALDSANSDASDSLGDISDGAAGAAEEFQALSDAVQASSAAWDGLLGRFLDERAAGRAFRSALAQAKAALTVGGLSPDDLAELADNIARSANQWTLAEQASGSIGAGTGDALAENVRLLDQARELLPQLGAGFDDSSDRLHEGLNAELERSADLIKEIQRIAAVIRINAIVAGIGATVAGLGDTATPLSRQVDTSARAGGSTIDAWRSIDATVPGVRSVSSHYRSWALGSGDSDHLTGRAVDVVGSNLPGLIAQVRRAGGAAELHGSGAGRHAHVVPALGGASGIALPPVVVHATGHLDASEIAGLERAVERGIKRVIRSTRERRSS